MRCALVGLLLLATFGALAHAAAPKPSDVTATLLADVSSVKPGMPFSLAIVLKTQPRWHVYWKNPGDAGAATAFTFKLPDGYKVENVQYPLPIKFTQAGDIVSYGYTGTVVFLATVTPPDKIETQKVPLGVDVSWLSCSDVCVPGGAKLSLELPTAKDAGEARAENADLFAKARALIPEASPPKDLVELVKPYTTDGRTALEISWKKKPAGTMIVFPLTPEGVEVSDIDVYQVDRSKTRVSMSRHKFAGVAKVPETMPILLVYEDDKGQRHGFFSSVSLK